MATKVKGTCTIRFARSKLASAVAEGDSVPAGAIVSTAEGSSLMLISADKTGAYVEAQSTLRIEALATRQARPHWALVTGEVVVGVTPAQDSKAADFMLETPVGEVSSSAATFRVVFHPAELDATPSFGLECLAGLARWTPHAGPEIDVIGGKAASLVYGAMPKSTAPTGTPPSPKVMPMEGVALRDLTQVAVAIASATALPQ